jgi:nitrate/nitrite transport system substrate-binding protein
LKFSFRAKLARFVLSNSQARSRAMEQASNGGRHRQSCRSGHHAIPDVRTREGLDGSFFRFGPETTMTKRIGPSLKHFTRSDFLASSALTAVLFIAALLLFPASHETEGKGPHVTAQSPSR